MSSGERDGVRSFGGLAQSPISRSRPLAASDAVVVAAKRTPIGRIGGILRDVEVEDLAAAVLRGLLAESPQLNPADVDSVALGNVVGPGGNVARLSALTAGLPLHVPGYTVDMQCGSGLQAIHLAAMSIRVGQANAVIAGGVESTSRAPWKLERPHDLHRGAPQVYTRARFSPDAIGDPEMGEAAENVAQRYGISRARQDEFALASHRKAVAARERIKPAIVPVVPRPGEAAVTEDECPRPDTSLEKLARLRPVFREGGSVTAGNACPVNDAASAVLMLSAQRAHELGFRTGIRYVDAAVVGVDPNVLGIGPIPATEQVLARQQLRIGDIDLVEFNEAFASQVLACVDALGIRPDRLNVNGGAIAYGHPYGASGAVLVTHLFHELLRREGRYGLTTLGIGGGLGITVLWERVKL